MKVDLTSHSPCIPLLSVACDNDPLTHAFVLRHGRHFTPAPLPPGIPRGPMKNCFATAAMLAFADSRLLYVEGVARRFCGHNYLPFCHAWCSDSSGKVIDPTWAEPHGIEYFGIPIRTAFLRDFINANQRWRLIDPAWLHQISALPKEKWFCPIQTN